ncbi:hypothetical protein IFM89_032081, partial [Coptis chinensis]
MSVIWKKRVHVILWCNGGLMSS